MDKAVELTYIGGLYAGQHPTPFLSLTLKMLQLQPEREIINEIIKQEDFKQVSYCSIVKKKNRMLITQLHRTGISEHLVHFIYG